MAKYMKTEDGYQKIETVNSNKMDANNPVGTGTFSMGRKPDSPSGPYSHAEGYNTTASGYCSHAEGYNTTASGYTSHTEGTSTVANNDYSHAEGVSAVAKGISSHAEGKATIANGECQHVQGKYNVEDSKGKYAHIVGNGISSTKHSNAHTLDWNGVPWFQGRPQFGGTAQDQGSNTVMANGDKEIILTSSTGAKKFKITVDDSGNISATEIIT